MLCAVCKSVCNAHARAQCLSFISNASILMLSLCDSLHLFYTLSLMFPQSPQCNSMQLNACVCRVEVASTSRKPTFSSSFIHSHSSPHSLKCLCCLSFISFLCIKELQTPNLSTHSPLTHRIKTHAQLTLTQSAALPPITTCMHPTNRHPKTPQNIQFHVFIFSTSN